MKKFKQKLMLLSSILFIFTGVRLLCLNAFAQVVVDDGAANIGQGGDGEGTATLLPGPELNVKFKALMGISNPTTSSSSWNSLQIIRSETKAEGKSYQILSTSDSNSKIYAWYEGNTWNGGVIYYYSNANVLYMNEDSSSTFANFAGLKSIDFSGWNASRVMNMSGMFHYDYNLEELDISEWDTSNVTNMSYMFYYINNITSLEIGEWDTSKVENMSHMFENLEAEELDISEWDTSNVTNMSYMFEDSKVEELDVSNWDTSNVKDMSYMFSSSYESNSFIELDLSRWDTSKVTNMSHMFYNAKNLSNLNISNWNTSNVTGMDYMFSNTYNLLNLDISNWNVSNVTDMSCMFSNDMYRTRVMMSLNLNNWNLNENVNFENIFGGLKVENLYVTNWNVSKVKNLSLLFANTSITSFDISNWNVSNVTGMNSMFNGASLSNLDLSSWNVSNVTNMDYMFANVRIKNLNLSSWDIRKASMSYMFSNIGYVSISLDNWVIGNGANLKYLFKDARIADLNLNSWDMSSVKNLSYLFYEANIVNLDVSDWDTSSVTDMSYAFSYATIQNLDISEWDTSNVTNMSYMFEDSKVEELDVSNWDTSNVENMESMFNGASSLQTLDVSNWNTSNVTNMQYMFDGVSSLQTLDVSKWDTSKVTNMSFMFTRAKKLQTLDVSKWNTSNVENMGSMFNGASSLQTLDVSKWNTSNVENMGYMFNGASSLQTLDISRWNTSKVKSMYYMFYNMKEVRNLDVSNWNVGNVTTMDGLFYGVKNIKTLDLSNWNTSNVKSLSRMFTNCSNLEKIYVSSNFVTSQVSNSIVFGGNLKLVGGNGTKFSSLFTTLEYAVIDKPGEPGYFSDKYHYYISYWDKIGLFGTGIVDRGNKIQTIPSVPEREIGTFLGRYESGATIPFDFNDAPTGNISLYQRWDCGIGYMDTGKSCVESVEIGFNTMGGSEKESIIIPKGTKLVENVKKYSHTPNITDDGIRNGNYATRLSLIDKITIPGAKSLKIRIKYGTNSRSDYVCIKQGNYIYSNVSCDSSSMLILSGAENTLTYEILGDTATILFYSYYQSGNGYGYYAEIEGNVPIYSLGENPIKNNYSFLGWYKDENYDESFDEDEYIANENKTLFAKWEQKKTAKLLPGPKLNEIFFSLAGSSSSDYSITSVIPSDTRESGTNVKVISTSDSENEVVAWYKNGKIYYYSEANKIFMNENSKGIFKDLRKLNFVKLDSRDASEVTDMSYMFYDTFELSTIDISNWDTSNVTNMSYMFYCSRNLETIDIGNWNTSKVTDMNHMFSSSHNMVALDLNNWDTSSVTNMSYMLSSLYNLKVLNISNWDTSSVTDMSYMFDFTDELEVLDIGNWNTSKVTNMKSMFHRMSNLKSLDLNNWNTSNVTNMSSMFEQSSNLEELEIGNWNTSKVENMNSMFRSLSTIETLDIGNWDTRNVTDMSYMFNNTNSLKILDLNDWDTSNVENMTYMFYKNLDSSEKMVLNINNWNTSKVKNMSYMFSNINIENLDLNNWDTSSVTNVYGMFSNIKTDNLGVNDWNTSNITNMANLFYRIDIESLDLSKWDTSKVTNMEYIFSDVNIKELNLSGWSIENFENSYGNIFPNAKIENLNVSNWIISSKSTLTYLFSDIEVDNLDLSTWDVRVVKSMEGMFNDSKIKILDLSNWDTSNVENMRGMFSKAEQLTTIYVTDGFTTSNLSQGDYYGGYEMFLDNWNIVGGNGTVYDPNRAHDLYARIDRPGVKGYFTDKNNIYVSFFVNGSIYTTSRTATGGKIQEPVNPKRSNSIFLGWYTEENGNHKYNFNLPIYDNLSLYAKWTCKEGTEPQGNRCVAKAGLFKEIEIVKPSSLDDYQGEESYIIMDRNMGALGGGGSCTRPDVEEICGYEPTCEDSSSSGDGGDGYGYGHGGSSGSSSTSNDDSCKSEYLKCAENYNNTYGQYCEEYGLYYQWGNYYGFQGDEEVISERVNTLGCSLNNDSNNESYENGYGHGGNSSNSNESCDDVKYSWSNPYEESKFIYDSSYSDWSTEINDDLWGAIEDTDISRQGPCPNGWHVPTQKEWNDALTYWNNREKVGDETDNMSFKEYLGLAGAGYRSPLSSLNNVGESWYWTTTPSGSQMYRLRIQGDSVGISLTDRMNALPVRCFKNQSLERQVTFDSNGGNSISAQTVMVGEYATKPNNPIKAGYVFLGWYKDNGTFNNEFDFSTKIKSNTTLYAKWEKLNKVTFETNGGSSISAIYLRSGKQILGDEISGKKVSHTENIDDNGVRDGGYGNDQNLKDVVTIPGAEQLKIVLTYQSEDGYDGVCIKKGDYSYYDFDGCDNSDTGKLWDSSKQTKEFIIEGDTVTFIFGSDGGVDDYYGYYAEITGYKKLKNPTKTSYSFEGWYKDSGLSEIWDFNTDTVNSDITLYAKWNKVPVYTFKAGEGTFSDGETENMVTYEKKSAKKSGYYTCENVNKFSVPYAEKINLELSDINSSSLKIVDKQGVIKEIVPEYDYYSHQVAQTVEVEGDYVEVINEEGFCYTISLSGIGYYIDKEIEKPSREGYSFEGWYREGANGEEIDFDVEKDFVKEDITLHAKWKKNLVYTYNANSGKFSDDTTEKTVEYGKKGIEKKVEGFGFGAGRMDVEMRIYGSNGIVADVSNDKCYNSISFGNSEQTKTVAQESYGYGFNFEGDSIIIEKNGCDSAKVTIYGLGYEIENTTIENPTREGYTFAGWYREISDGKFVEFKVGKDFVDEDTTIYAKWDKNVKYKYDANEGKFSDNTDEKEFEFEKKEVIKKLEGFGDDSAKIVITGAENLEVDGVNITCSEPLIIKTTNSTKTIPEYGFGYGNKFEGDSIIVENNGCEDTKVEVRGRVYEITTVEQPTRQGYTFDGWYREGANGEQIDFDIEKDFVAEDITLHAKWLKNIVYTYNANGGKYSDDTDEKYFEYPRENVTRETVGFGYGNGKDDVFMKIIGANGIDVDVSNDECSDKIKVYNSLDTLTVKPNSFGYGYGFDGDSIFVKKNGCDTAKVTLKGVGYDIGNEEVETPTKDGYEFVGWNTDPEANDKLDVLPNEALDTTFYAIFTKKIEVTFDINGNSGSTQKVSCNLYNDDEYCSITAPEIPEQKGWEVIGYDTDKDGHENNWSVGEKKVVSEDMTYYAQVKRLPIQKYVSFDINGNTSFKYGENPVVTTSGQYELCQTPVTYNGVVDNTCSAEIVFPTIVASGTKEVLGWSRSPENLSDIINVDTLMRLTLKGETTNVTYYAQTKKDKVTYSVIFNGNGALLRNNAESALQSQWTASCETEDSYNSEDETKSTECEIQLPEIIREGYTILGYSTGIDDLEASIKRAQEKLILTPENNWTIYYAISYKPLYTVFKTNGNLQIQSNTTITTEKDVTEPCSLRNANTTCTIKTPVIVGTKQGEVWYSSSDEKANRFDNRQNEDTEIIVSEDTPKTYYAWSVSNPETFTVSYLTGKGIESIGEIPAGADQCTPELTYNDEELKTTCTITNLPNVIQKVGYNTPLWYDQNDDSEGFTPNSSYNTEINRNITFVANATANTDTQYIVKHYFQMLEDNKITNKYELKYTDTKAGETDTNLILSNLQVDEDKSVGFKYRLGKVNGQFTSNEIPEDELEGLSEQNLDAYDGAKVLEIHLFYQRMKYAFALENNDPSKIDVTGSSSNNNYYYEQELDLSGSVTNDCYVRSGWDGIDTGLEIIETSGTKNIAKLKMPPRALTVSPEVKEKTYNVSFNKNAENVEGEMETLVAVKCSEGLTLPVNQFKKNGYSFLGWSRAAESEKEFDDNETLDTPLTKDNNKHETLYAQWHLDAYEINYALNDGIVLEPNPSIYTYENGDVLINNPIKTGYTFLGWSGTDINGSSYEVIIPSGSTGDRNYEANWEINHYSIYFNTEGGSEVETITQEYATPVTAPSDPTKEGYTFLGWNKEIPSTMPAEDTTITANWHINTYNFTLTGNGGIINGEDEIYSRGIVYNDEVEVPEVERLGYTFLGWNIELPERMPAEDTGAIAQWQANKYTVKFVNGDEEKIQEFEYDEEKALDENTFEKEGYTFAGWISGARTYNDKQVVKNLTANSGEVIELTAEWNPVPYTVTFYKNDGTNEKTVEHFVYDKQRAIQTSYERDGYFFKGWNTESDGNGEIKESPVLNWTNEGGTNINLYAQWELVPYTIVYTLDGGNPVEENPNNYGVESEFALKDPSRVGYDFLGWTGGVIDETYRNELNWTSEPSKEIVITYGSTGDRVYTAKWQARDDISYTVKHVLQALDGSYDDENGYPDYLEGTADSTVVPVVNKYSGFSDATTGEYTINPDGSTVIFYHYPRNSYKLTFKRDNGSDDTSATLKYGETIVYPENPTKVGYTFFSWSEIDDTMPAKDFEIWALYDINQYTLTLNTNGGSEIAPITQDFDTEITVPETTKIGYTFAGWEPKIPARMPAENISSSAQWNANPYKVIFHANNLTSTDIENGVEELLDVQDFVYDEPQKLQSNSFEKAGYHFLGWSNSSLSTEVIYANEQQVNNLTSQSDGTIDLYAVWEPDDDTVYKVKYLLQNIENDEYTALDNEEETLGGVTDTPTKAEAKTFEGFTLVPFEQKNINGDGSTVVEIKYTRDEYTITFNSNKGSAVNPMTLRYNSGVIAPENPNRLGYTFNGWTPSLPSNMPANNFEVTAEWLANTGTHFTVEYYVEYTTGGYSETPTQTVVKTGTTDTSTNFTAPEMEGFVVQPYENKNIEPDESTVLKIYYKRLIHKVTYDSRGGSEVATKEVRFGEKIERPAITKVGYRFDGWSGKEFMPNEDVTLTAEWTARSDIKYTVKHLQENANDEGYTENEADREELIGTTDTPTQAVSKDYPGFVAQQFSQENIKGDNTTVVEIKYNRLSYDITFNSNKGTKVNKITAKYDENLTAPEDPTRKGYTFDGWNPQFPSTMPLNGAELTAQWSANTGTAYVVHHYLANLDGSFPAKRDYEDESQGETDTPTKAAPKVVAGYTAQAFEQENIEGDGSTVVNIYYDRNIYTVSYDANGGTTPTEERMIFGDVIPNKETTRPGYDFVEWTGATTVPAGDVTVKAIWNERDDTLYTVKHYLQKVSLDGYTEVAADREELHGRTNSDTQAEAKTYDGFTAKTFSQKAIEGEGTTVVQIFYDRNEYTLSFDSNGGTPVASITAKYGTALTYPANPIRTGYAFTSWSPKFPSEMPLDGGLLTAQWSANNNTQYSIEYYYQKLDGTYPEEPSLKKTASGTTDTQTDKVAETISGYTVQDFDQVNIDPEGDAVLKLYYNRNAYTLNYYSEVLGVKQEGEQAEKELKRSVTLKYQEPIDTTPLAKSGYRFEGWKNLPANGLMPYNDLDLEAQWSVNENTEYKVYHLLQNVYDDNYSIEEVTEKTGTTDTLTNAETIPFVGFTAKAFDQQYINGDNSTIVEIRYDRNSYTIDFDGNQGTTPNAITERFGTDLTAPAIPVRTGYTFAGWSPSFPSVMPAENRTLTAGWTANTTTKYTVSHYLQNVEDDAYTEDIPNRENKIGTTDTLTDASARTYDGFTAQKIKQENISGDNSTNVKIYYKRNYYTISFDANSGSETDPITDKYGATIIAPNNPTRLGYTFKGWNPSLPATIPVGDTTVAAQWKANTDTKYTIEYYLQGIDGKYHQVASLTRIATGETDTETNVVAEDLLGFKVHTIQQTNINSDESGIARVYYTREQYQVSYDTNGGTAIQERMVKFEDDIPTPETTREGYTFNSWANMPSNGKMPAESIELLAQWTPNTDTKYTIKHLWEKVDGSGYEVHATEEKIGTTEELTEASANNYDGFTALEFKQQVINGDGSTIVEIKYDRNTYDITFDTNGGLAKSPVSAKYEETLETTEDPEKEGYTFEEWEPTYPKSMPLRGARLMAKWTPNTDTEYTIEYYLQDIDNADDEYPDEPSYSTIATGTTDTVADVVVPVIEGFTAQDVDPVVIRPDGSSVVKIYYKRNSHQVTYDVDGGTTIPSETVKYEDYIPTPATAKTGYTFLEWLNMPSDGMMPDSDVELLASWRANNNTKYTVVHLQENANNSNYSEVAKETLTGTTDTLTKAVAKSYPGFNVESFVQEYINGDESTIIEIRYKRNQYTISFDANSGSVTEPITDKYGATLTAPNDPTRQGYTFAGWNPGFPSTMPLDGKTLRAQWTANDNTQYTIEYYLQELNGEYPTNPSSTRSAIGTTDEETNVVAETIEGFKAQPISKVKIAGDGSSVVRVYYTRNSYTLSYNTDGGSSIHDLTLLYEEAIPLPETTRAGYTFSSWKYLPSNGKMPANNLEIIAQWTANNNTKYTVRHLLENTYDDKYSEDESARETKTGTTDTQTKASAKSYPGFIALPVSQTTISGDESTIVDVKYARNVYVVDFNTRGGTTIDAITGKYQVALTEPSAPTKTGYVFNGWNSDFPETMPLDGKTLVAKWKASTGTQYTVYHYLADLNGTFGSEPADVDYLKGETEQLTQAKTKVYAGFEPRDITQETILADGSTIVNVYYDRKEYTVTYDPDGGTPVESVSLKFESPIPNKTTSKTGYDFVEWSGATTVPADDVTVTAIWSTRDDTVYTVKHFLENANDSGYAERVADETTETGRTEGMTNAKAKNYKGFTAQSIEQKTIEGDGSTVVKVYYTRNSYTINFNSDGGTAVSPITSKYGATVTAPENPTKTGYEFNGWSPNMPTTMPENGATLTAQWNASTTTYTVEHKVQSLEDVNTYTLRESEVVEGITESMTNAKAKDYSGFAADEISQVVINGDHSTIVPVYYTRQSYKLNYNVAGGEEIASVTLKYQENIPLPTPSKQGYKFVEWTNIPENNKMPANDVTLVAKWSPRTDTSYTVKYLTENLNDGGYTEVLSDRVVKFGTTEELTNATANTYAGFTVQSIEQKEIAGDGSTVVEVKYSRNTYTIDFDSNGGTSVPSITEKYQTILTVPENPTRKGYSFGGWEPKFPQVMGSEDTTLVAKWNAGESSYIVNHYVKNLAGDGYTLKEQETLAGKTESQTQAKEKSYEGFSLEKAIVQKEIKSDDSTSVNIYYKRNVYHITWIAGTGVETINESGDYIYGTTVKVQARTKVGYTFSGGVSEKEFAAVVPARNSNIIVSATPNTYTVRYHANGGEGKMDDQIFTYDITGTLNENTYVNSGNVLVGWSSEKGALYPAGSKVINLTTKGVFDLYAEWKTSYKVIYKDANAVLFEEEYASGGIIKPSRTPSKNGYRFDGWDGMPKDNLMGEEDIEVTAKWINDQPAKSSSGGGGGARVATKDTSSISTPVLVSEDSDTSVKKEEKTSTIEEPVTQEEDDHTSAKDTGETVKNVESHPTVTEEVLTAYQWAYKNEVTTLSPVERAIPDGYVYRGHMAKMVVNYALNVLGWKLPEETPEECSRSDDASDWESNEIKNYARMSCELGIMGIDMDNFEPTRYVTRAQFGTILSRLLWGDTYNQQWSSTNSYYERHLNELKEKGIITQIDNPEQRIELREWVWVMLKRSDEYIKSSNTYKLGRSNAKTSNEEGKIENKEETGTMSDIIDSLFKKIQ